MRQKSNDGKGECNLMQRSSTSTLGAHPYQPHLKNLTPLVAFRCKDTAHSAKGSDGSCE